MKTALAIYLDGAVSDVESTEELHRMHSEIEDCLSTEEAQTDFRDFMHKHLKNSEFHSRFAQQLWFIDLIGQDSKGNKYSVVRNQV